MTVSEEIKTLNNKIEHNKAQSDRQAANIFALSSENVRKYEFLTDEDVLPELDLLEKVATTKRFEYSSLGSDLKKQPDIAKKNNIKD